MKSSRALLAFALLGAITTSRAQVTFDRILHADREPQNWLQLLGHRRSTSATARSTQITPANVKNLELQWVWQARVAREVRGDARSSSTACSTRVQGRRQDIQSSRSTPPPAGRSGRSTTQPAPEARPCCGRVNRGLAILGDTLYMGTIDAHLIAIDAKTGKHRLERRRSPSSAQGTEKYSITHAPLVVKDKVIVGTAGGDLGDPRLHRRVRREDRQGSLALLHDSRRRASPATRRGRATRGRPAAPASGTAGAYDPETNLVYFGTGNPAPDWDGRDAPRRQPLQRQRRRARRRHRQAEVALPVHAARRGRLRLDAGARARRHRVAGPAAQGDAVGESQRPRRTCSIASTRRVPARQAVRQGELDGRLRRERPAAARAGQDPDARKAR